MSRYATGRRFEYRVRDKLKALGYLTLRSPRSAGAFDVIAVAPGVVLLVQCKVNGRCDPKEWNELYTLAQRVKGRAIIASRERRKIEWRQIYGAKSCLHKPQPWVHTTVCAVSNDQ